jgi:hypothetical protein
MRADAEQPQRPVPADAEEPQLPFERRGLAALPLLSAEAQRLEGVALEDADRAPALNL